MKDFEGIKVNIAHRLTTIAISQANDPDMVKFWYNEASKKEVILDAFRKIKNMKDSNQDQYDMMLEVLDMIPKGITMGSLV